MKGLEQFPLGRDSNRSNYPKSGQQRAEGREESCQRVMNRGLQEEGDEDRTSPGKRRHCQLPGEGHGEFKIYDRAQDR